MYMHRENHAIVIDRVRPDETETLLSLYVDLFYDREPLTKWLGLSRERMISVARSLHAGAATNPVTQGFCWIARDRRMNMREVGFIACDDPTEESSHQVPENLTDHDKANMETVLALMEEIRAPKKVRMGAERGKCLHIAAIGVAPGYEGTGIATRLLQTALADATARGFVHAFSECTSLASQNCHEKSGFQSLHCVAASDFVVNGETPFEDPNLNVYLLWKDLDEQETNVN